MTFVLEYHGTFPLEYYGLITTSCGLIVLCLVSTIVGDSTLGMTTPEEVSGGPTFNSNSMYCLIWTRA